MAQVPDLPLNSAGIEHTQSSITKALKTELKLKPSHKKAPQNWQPETHQAKGPLKQKK